MQRASVCGLVALIALAGCRDLSTSAERVPTSLTLDRDTITTVAGSAAAFQVRVLDQDGVPFERLPFWALPEWTSSDPVIVRPEGTDLRTAAPGQATVEVALATLRATALVRVNPTQLRLRVDSVAASQGEAPAEGRQVLVPGRDVALRVFVTGDQPNFFRPRVHVRVLRDGSVLRTFEIDRGRESVPQTIDPADPASTWNVTIPGALVQPGTAIEVRADPEGVVPRSPDARDRFPVSGSYLLPFGATLRVEAAYLTQSIQRLDGSVPLVAGRDALLRVFATSDAHVDARPVVRATFFHGGVPVRTFDNQRDSPSLPLEVSEADLQDSWNIMIPRTLIRPGTSMVVEIDPDATIPRASASRVRLPETGTLALNVREVPKLWVRVIPVHQTAFGTTGRVDAQNLEQFFLPTRTQFPIADYDVDLRATYTTNARLDTQTGWSQLLREIDALRTADGSRRYYYGVHTNPPGSPWGGLGYLGWPAAIGHDRGSSGAITMAHELGHNFSLLHAPCGNPASVDPQFPYAGGGIGVFGYEAASWTVHDPATAKDLMSYCGPRWISDYHFVKALEFRHRVDWTGSVSDRAAEREPALLVWGGVEGGALVLEPAFSLEMRPSLPSSGGRYRIEGYDAGGALLFSLAFEPNTVDHSTLQKGFSFAIPASLARTERLAELRLRGPEGVASLRRAPEAAVPSLSAERGAGRVALAWQSAAHPMALVRDAATGEILSFARGGAVEVPTGARPVEILLSDGVRSVRTFRR